MTTDELLLCLRNAEQIIKGFPAELDDGSLEVIEATLDGFDESHFFSAISVASVTQGKWAYGSSHLATGCRIARFLIHEAGLTPKTTALLMWDFQDQPGELIDSLTFIRSFQHTDLLEKYFEERGLGTRSCEVTLRTAGFLKTDWPEERRTQQAINHYFIPYLPRKYFTPPEIKRENGIISIQHKHRDRKTNKVSLVRIKLKDIGPALILTADLFRRNADARDQFLQEKGILIERMIRRS